MVFYLALVYLCCLYTLANIGIGSEADGHFFFSLVLPSPALFSLLRPVLFFVLLSLCYLCQTYEKLCEPLSPARYLSSLI